MHLRLGIGEVVWGYVDPVLVKLVSIKTLCITVVSIGAVECETIIR